MDKLVWISKDSKNLHSDVTKAFVALGWRFKYRFFIYRDRADWCNMHMEIDDRVFDYVGATVAECMNNLIVDHVEIV